MDDVFKGMSEEKLLELVSDKNIDRGSFPWLYWTSELYSFGRYIRKYGYLPAWLPLNVYSNHSGPSGNTIPYPHEIETDAPAFLTFNIEKAENFRKITGKKSYIIIAPSVFYRRNKEIEQSQNAIGTLAFPAHSTQSVENVGDLDLYAKKLKELPEEYQPVVVCMHMHDIVKGQHNVFMEHGISCVTAGNTSDQRFIERFYAIMKNFKYTTSNLIGTYTSLSIEMNIPFFVYGPREKYMNKSDPNIPQGEYDGYAGNPYNKMLFDNLQYDGFNGGIDNELKLIVQNNLGISDGLTRIRLSIVLWKSCMLWFCSEKSIKLFYETVKKVVKKCIPYRVLG